MSRYRGPRLKKYAVWELYQDSQEKHINPEVILKKIQFLEKGAISYSSSRKTEIAFSLWSDRTTIT